MNWKVYPFLRIAPSFIIGILLHEGGLLGNMSCYILLLFGAIIFLSYCFTFLFSKTSILKKLNIVLGLASIIVMGYLSAHLRYSFNKPSVSQDQLTETSLYQVVIKSNAISTEKRRKYEAEILRLKAGGQWYSLGSGVILYFPLEIDDRFSYGDKLLINGNPHWIQNQTNPYAFDYGKFLQRKGFYLQAFVSAEDYVKIGSIDAFSIDYYSLLAGNYFDQILAKYITAERELDVARAMIIGRRQEISEEMLSVYQTTGTAHILAVSGLHVGILFFILSWILRPLKLRKQNKLYYSLIIICIWAFAFITGNSPSVQRAALMFSIILLAKLMSRKSNIYNSIFFSGFVILLFNPNLIFSVSFQLSFAAVLGIVYLYKRIYPLIYIKSKYLNFFWKITVLSISAQIATFPISIYYFHQFPTLFLITNIIAIPTATIVLSSGIILMITSKIPVVPDFIGNRLTDWIYFYNECVSFVSRLEFASIQGIYFSSVYVFIIILCIILFVRFVETRRLLFFKSITAILFVFAAWSLFNNFQKSRQQKITIYETSGRSYFDVYLGFTCFTNAVHSSQDIAYNLAPNRRNSLISEVKSISEYENARMIGASRIFPFDQKIVLFLTEPSDINGLPSDLVIDYLVVGNKSAREIDLITRKIKYREIVLDSSVSEIQALRLKNGDSKSSKIHAISLEGAFEISI